MVSMQNGIRVRDSSWKSTTVLATSPPPYTFRMKRAPTTSTTVASPMVSTHLLSAPLVSSASRDGAAAASTSSPVAKLMSHGLPRRK